MKLVPLTVRVNAAEPAAAVAGAILLKVGNGLLTGVLLMMKLREELVPPPGAAVITDMAAVPAVVMYEAGTTVEICVALT